MGKNLNEVKDRSIIVDSNTNIDEELKKLDLSVKMIERCGIKYGVVYLPYIINKYPG